MHFTEIENISNLLLINCWRSFIEQILFVNIKLAHIPMLHADAQLIDSNIIK